MKLISINNVVKTTILRALHKQLLSPTIPTPISKQLSFYLFEKFEENSVKVFVKDKPDYLWKTKSFRFNLFFIFGLFGFISAHLSKKTHRRSTGYPIINTRDFQKLLTLKLMDKKYQKSNSISDYWCVGLNSTVGFARKSPILSFVTFISKP